MAHGGYGKRRVDERQKPPNRRRQKSLAVDKKTKPKSVSIKNQIRSTERMLRKDLPPEMKEAQQKKLDELKRQQENLNRLAVERKIFLRNRKIRFFERRKIERRIRRVEKQLRSMSGQANETELAEQLSKTKEDLVQDLEYVKFFPKTESYVPLFTGGEDVEITEKRTNLRERIKAKIVAAAASGKDLEETGSEDDGLLDQSDDDFFLSGSSSDEADADDEWTDKSTREQASSASGKAASGMSSDDKNQRQNSARVLMPPPRPSQKSFPGPSNDHKRFGKSSSKKPTYRQPEMSTSSNTSNSTGFRKITYQPEMSTSSNTSNSTSFRKPTYRQPEMPTSSNTSNSTGFRNQAAPDRNQAAPDPVTGNSDNVSSVSDARKPKRKRRPKKKNKQT